MPLYRPGHVMAAIYQGDDSGLMAVERLIYRLICRMAPYRRSMRERWLFSQKSVLEMHREGINAFLIPGAGIPTSGHVHQLLPDAKVLYVDKDETIVRMAQEMLADSPNARYIQGDLRDWGEVELHCREFFGPEPKVGVLFIGASYFFSDEDLQKLFRALYEWAGIGSKMVVDYHNSEAPNPLTQRISRFIYAVTGNPWYSRNDAQFRSLLEPWCVEKVEPIFYSIPSGLTLRVKTFEELTEGEKKIPPLLIAYKVYKAD